MKMSVFAILVCFISACSPLAPSVSKNAPPACNTNDSLSLDIGNVHVGDTEAQVDSKLHHSYSTMEANSQDVIRRYDDSNTQAGCQHYTIRMDIDHGSGNYVVSNGYPLAENN